MKFGKELRTTVQNSLPEWRPMFMSYKALKRSIHPLPSPPPPERPPQNVDDPEHSTVASTRADGDNGEDDHGIDNHAEPAQELAQQQPAAAAVAAAAAAAAAAAGARALTHADRVELARKNAAFVRELASEVQKVNAFFLDKQEDYVILAEQLERDVVDTIHAAAPRSRVVELKRRLIEFHGCLVLLDNYSHVNYQGFRKILKKHDKKTGLNIREAYLSAVVGTPFLLGDTVRRLLQSTEQRLEELDALTKFRRVDNPTALAVAAAATAAVIAVPDHAPLQQQHSTQHVSERHFPPSNAPQWASAAALATAAHPRACIGPQSALYCAWRNASRLTDQIAAESTGLDDVEGQGVADAESPAATASPAVQALLDSLDAITTRELGVDCTFLRSVPRPANYIIASTDTLSMGFFVVGPHDPPLQLFRHPRTGFVISRLLRGRARLTCFQRAVSSSCSEETSVGDEHADADAAAHRDDDDNLFDQGAVNVTPSASSSLAPESISNAGPMEYAALDQSSLLQNHPSAFDLIKKRTGIASGPWPAVMPFLLHDCVQWIPLEENVAIFYIMSPPLHVAELPCYDLEMMDESSRNVVLPSSESSPAVVHATLRSCGLTLERLQCW